MDRKGSLGVSGRFTQILRVRSKPARTSRSCAALAGSVGSTRSLARPRFDGCKSAPCLGRIELLGISPKYSGRWTDHAPRSPPGRERRRRSPQLAQVTFFDARRRPPRYVNGPPHGPRLLLRPPPPRAGRGSPINSIPSAPAPCFSPGQPEATHRGCSAPKRTGSDRLCYRTQPCPLAISLAARQCARPGSIGEILIPASAITVPADCRGSAPQKIARAQCRFSS